VKIAEKDDIVSPPMKYNIEPTKEKLETTMTINNVEESKTPALTIQTGPIKDLGAKVKNKLSGRIDQAIVPAGSNFE
jgi:hypothetical protein